MSKLVRKINNTVLDFVRGVPFQSLNKFEINLSMENELASSSVNANGGGVLANLAQVIFDFATDRDQPTFDKLVRIGASVILQLYAQSVTVSLPEIETASLVNGVKYIKDLKMPDEFEISFLEDELGLTLRFIDLWRLKIVGYDNYVMYSDRATSKSFIKGVKRPTTPQKSTFSWGSNTKEKEIQNFSGSILDFFNNEYSSRISGQQLVTSNLTRGIEAYKANMTLKPLSLQDDLGVPPYPSFQMKGVFPKSIDSITFSQDSSDFLIHKVKFSVDTVYTRFI